MSLFYCHGCEDLRDSDDSGFNCRSIGDQYCDDCWDTETDCAHCKGVGDFGSHGKCGWCWGTGKRNESDGREDCQPLRENV